MELVLAGLRAAAEPTRLRLLFLCARAELTVSELTEILGQSQPRVSRHLKLLCEAGLLDRVREGSWVFHRLSQSPEGGRLARLLAGLVPENDPFTALDLERLDRIKRARAAAAAEYFRVNAADWDRIRSLYIGEAEIERAVVDLVLREEVGSLLDIGTGTGRMLEVLGPRVDTALGIDLSREMLAVARTSLDRAGLTNCALRRGDMYRLPLPGASFDAVVIHQVLHYADRPAAAIAEAARVVAPGGRLVIVDFAPHALEFLRAEHAHRRLGFADDEIRDWCEAAGLRPEPSRRLPGTKLTVAIWVARRPGADAERAVAPAGTAELPAAARAVLVNPTGLV